MSSLDQQAYAAWVSAGAAVVQAVAAGAAIWYSGKLARDAAAREKAADEAAARRIEQANAAAVEQRRLDRKAAEYERNLSEVRAFNEPLGLAIGFADHAFAEIADKRRQEHEKVLRKEGDLHRFEPTPGQLLVRERFPTLIEDAKDAPSAAAIRAVHEHFAPFSNGAFQTATDWLPMVDGQLSLLNHAIDALREQIIHPE